jgi:hypothetical protein
MSTDTSNTEESKVTDDEDVPVFTWFYDGVGIDDGTGDAILALSENLEALATVFGLRDDDSSSLTGTPDHEVVVLEISVADDDDGGLLADLKAFTFSHVPFESDGPGDYAKRRAAYHETDGSIDTDDCGVCRASTTANGV